MCNIIGVRFKDTDIPEDWRKIVRPCGMNNIIWFRHRYPSSTEKQYIRYNQITSTEVCVIFDANDNPVEFITK